MQLRKWMSNSEEVLNGIDQQIKNDASSLDIDRHMKVLGLAWQPISDTVSFQTSELSHNIQDLIPTRRTLLSTVARIYDPIGLITPYTIAGKILFQEVWKIGLQWHDPLPCRLVKKWSNWINDMLEVQIVQFSRSFCNGVFDELKAEAEFHIFVDSSETAYGSAVYLKTKAEPATVHLVISLARVAPIKRVTIPRLELLAAVIGVRLMNKVKEALQLSSPSCCYCTGSMVALCWIKGSADRWKHFVANRVREIQELSGPNSWRFCPGDRNPADMVTRFHSVHETLKTSTWLHGPSWLQDDHEKWPKAHQQDLKVSIPEIEARTSASLKVSISSTVPLFKMENYSSCMTEKWICISESFNSVTLFSVLYVKLFMLLFLSL
ncbi:Uncharacterised protein g4091 [Pycnogonum litorale]